MEKDLDSMEESLLNGVDMDSLHQIFHKIDAFRAMADTEGSLKHQVSARRYNIRIGFETDRLEHVIADVIWIAGKWDSQRDHASLDDEMEHLERLVECLPLFPKISVEHIERVLNLLGEWLQSRQRSPHFLEWAKFKTYQKLGKTEAAEKHKAALLALEAEQPADILATSDCTSCGHSQLLYYYTSLGLYDKAIEKAAPLLSGDVSPCLTSPRVGLAYLIDMLVDRGDASGDDAAQAMAAIANHVDFPAKAPLRVIVPLLRYHLATGNLEAAGGILQRYLPELDENGDIWNARRFYLAASTHPEYDGQALLAKAEALGQVLQR